MRVYSQADYTNFTDFEKQAQALMDHIYLLKGFASNRNGACVGFDTIITGANGTSWKIEEKYRRNDYGDFGIELLQDAVTGKLGWAYYTKAEVINYVICDNDGVPSNGYYVDWQKFMPWLEEYLRHHKIQKVFISDLGKGLTINLSVKWSVIPDELCRRWRMFNER